MMMMMDWNESSKNCHQKKKRNLQEHGETIFMRERLKQFSRMGRAGGKVLDS
jgi:hypothetical protein